MSRINLEDPIIERPIIRGGIKYGVTTVPGTGNTTLDADMGPIIQITPTAARTLTLPTVTADMRGLTMMIANNAAFALTVQNASAATVATVPATIGATGSFTCLGDTALGIGGWVGGL
jgi:hypothetical protein